MQNKIIPLSFLLICGVANANETVTGKIIKISDGDTLTILVSKKQMKIRLAEIDCPEKNQPYGKIAKKALSELAFSKIASIKPVTIDRYKRTVGTVFIDGLNVNKELVKTGNCWVYRKYSKDKDMIELEYTAKYAKFSPSEPA